MPHTPEEILAGVWHWSAPHPKIRVEVDSYWLARSGVLIDPLVPVQGGGLEWFDERSGGAASPTAIVLSNRLHSRESARFLARFGCGVHAPASGMHQPEVRALGALPYEPGSVLPGELVAWEIGSLCPDDMALADAEAGAVYFADGVVLGWSGGRRGDGEPELGFVPDGLMDDPPGTKRGLLAALATLLEGVEFEHVMCAHGGPLLGGRSSLEELVRVGLR